MNFIKDWLYTRTYQKKKAELDVLENRVLPNLRASLEESEKKKTYRSPQYWSAKIQILESDVLPRLRDEVEELTRKLKERGLL